MFEHAVDIFCGRYSTDRPEIMKSLILMTSVNQVMFLLILVPSQTVRKVKEELSRKNWSFCLLAKVVSPRWCLTVCSSEIASQRLVLSRPEPGRC
jgi:hypothetical protein